ncbi:uncharacterized protein LOC103361172 [Stegastes partitus]|uniref:Uncharacterized protein LOC103361172 n=2 Tax=Stegastes partitus TaxID=144197 RepID=A0A9Y4KA22_9TELE|nr:PREDICTED: uncharacterized protein LOC103361172 [Stegastes partitus]
MTAAQLVFYLTCLSMGKMAQMDTLKIFASVHQQNRFLSGTTGDDVTLQCFYEGDAVMLYWYKQTLGQKPRLISTFYKHDINATFHNEFKGDPRFTLFAAKGENHLKITDLHASDSATYFCASSYLYTLEFAEGIIINVNQSGWNIRTLVQQSASQTVQPGDSVTLNCTVQTGTCDGEHSVHWFKSEEDSQPGLIYTHGGRNDQCERKPNAQTCVYNLPMKSLNLSHAGTYYCAVASCGHILFGNGTKLDFEDEGDSLVLVYVLGAAVAFTTILSVLLLIDKINTCLCAECHARLSDPSTKTGEGHKPDDHLCYIALRAINRSRRQKDETWSECVYFNVRQ